MKKILLSILISALCVSAAASAENEMTVIDVQGTSFVQHPQIDTVAPLNKDDRLQAEDIIITTEASLADIELPDGSVLHIGENSRCTIKGTDRKNMRLAMNKGLLFGLIKLKKQSSLEIETPTAIAAIRGTSFALIVLDTMTTLFVEEGNVQFRNPERPKAVLNVGSKTAAVSQMNAKPRTLQETSQEASDICARLYAWEDKYLPKARKSRVRQSSFAVFLAQHLGLEGIIPAGSPIEQYFTLLSQMGVEPPGGWDKNKYLSQEEAEQLLVVILKPREQDLKDRPEDELAKALKEMGITLDVSAYQVTISKLQAAVNASILANIEQIRSGKTAPPEREDSYAPGDRIGQPSSYTETIKDAQGQVVLKITKTNVLYDKQTGLEISSTVEIVDGKGHVVKQDTVSIPSDGITAAAEKKTAPDGKLTELIETTSTKDGIVVSTKKFTDIVAKGETLSSFRQESKNELTGSKETLTVAARLAAPEKTAAPLEKKSPLAALFQETTKAAREEVLKKFEVKTETVKTGTGTAKQETAAAPLPATKASTTSLTAAIKTPMPARTIDRNIKQGKTEAAVMTSGKKATADLKEKGLKRVKQKGSTTGAAPQRLQQ